MLREYGVSRISIGIQTFDFGTLRRVARTFTGHTKQDEEKAVKILLDSGIPNINVDMIQDLPLVTSDYDKRLRNDLMKVAELRPPHITWYNLRLRPETTDARKGLQLLDERQITERQSLASRLTIWNFLEAIGYQVLEGDRFALEERYEDLFRKTRGSLETDLIGLGVSAYSHVDSMFFRNPRVTGGKIRKDSRKATQEYIQRVLENGYAIFEAFEITPDEELAGKFALGLKRGVPLSVFDEYRVDPEIGAYSDFVLRPTTKLIDAGLLEVENGILQFTKMGMLFENEICAQFYSPRVKYLAHRNRATINTKIQKEFEDYIIRQEMYHFGMMQKLA